MGLILLFQLWNIVGGGGGGVFIFFMFRGVRLGEKLKVIHFGIKYEAKVLTAGGGGGGRSFCQDMI